MTRAALTAAFLAAAFAAAPAHAGVCKVSGASCYIQYDQSFTGQVERITYTTSGVAQAEVRATDGTLWRVGSEADDFAHALQSANETGALVEVYMVGADAKYLTLEAPERPVEVLSTIEVLLWDLWSWSAPAVY